MSSLAAGVRDLNANEPMAMIGMAARFPGCHGNGTDERGAQWRCVGTSGMFQRDCRLPRNDVLESSLKPLILRASEFRWYLDHIRSENLGPRYWAMLCNGLDMISTVPIERWDIDLYHDPDPSVPGKMRHGYVSHRAVTRHTIPHPCTGYHTQVVKRPGLNADLNIF